MTPSPERQLIRLASDYLPAYEDARRWFLAQGPSIVPVLTGGLEDDQLGFVAHWRILLLLREFALPATMPAILKSFHNALESRNPIVLPGAMEALPAIHTPEPAAALVSVLEPAPSH